MSQNPSAAATLKTAVAYKTVTFNYLSPTGKDAVRPACLSGKNVTLFGEEVPVELAVLSTSPAPLGPSLYVALCQITLKVMK